MSNERHLSPPTAFLCWLLKTERTRTEAMEESRRLGIDAPSAEYWWRNVRRT